MYTYQNYKFLDKATADPLLQGLTNVDEVGLIDGTTGWHVNVAFSASETEPSSLLPYKIPNPLYPKRVWFIS